MLAYNAINTFLYLGLLRVGGEFVFAASYARCPTSQTRRAIRLLPVAALVLGFGLWLNNGIKEDQREFMPKCAASEDPVFLRYHLDNGGDANMWDEGHIRRGWTLLMIASSGHNTKVVRLLLARGAAVTLRDAKGRTALSIVRTRAADSTLSPQERKKYRQTALLLEHAAGR